METLDQLVAERRGYKYLSKTGVSPYQNYQYDLKSKKQLKAGELDHDKNNACGEGWNLATIKWIANNCLKLDGVIVECSIPTKAVIIVPKESDGKFRTDIIKIKKVHQIPDIFPALKDIQKRLADYKPVNPITAEEMPPISKIKKILAQVRAQVGAQVRAQVGAQARDQVWDQVWDQVRAQARDQVRAQVGDQVWDQVWAQVGDQVGDQVWAQVWAQVGDQVGAQVRAQVRAQVGDQVGAQVWDQVGDQVWDQARAKVGDQVWVAAYFAVKNFLNLDYDHPAFELIRLGIMVVNVLGKVKVFGKNGKFLGEFE
jgi:hypothetical protein